MTTFLRNQWYPGAWGDELIGSKPLGRKILGEEIAFYRTESGAVAALAARCPHRFAPLDYGDVKGENLKCRYHGLQFGPDGRCAVNPDGSAPPQASVKSYPVREHSEMVWIWMGEQAPGPLPKTLDFPSRMGAPIHGHLQVGGNALLLSDNLMDAVHATHLHAAFETSGHIKNPKQEIHQEGDTVGMKTFIPDTPLIQAFGPLYDKPGNVDQWIHITWNLALTSTVSAGVSPVGRPPEEGISVTVVHLFAPETENSCHYFWKHVRDCQKENEELSKGIAAGLQQIFVDEDKWMIEGQVRAMGGQDFWALRPVLMPQDRLAVLARKHFEKLIAEQEAHRIAAE